MVSRDPLDSVGGFTGPPFDPDDIAGYVLASRVSNR
jgi:hypothetical protein